MRRDTLITVLLVIAGIVLAFILFGAGALWRGRTAPKRSSQTDVRQESHIRSSGSDRITRYLGN
jgi:hypothetical protein